MKTIRLIFIYLVISLCSISCRERKNFNVCKEDGFAEGMLLYNVSCKLERGKLYLYESNSQFNNLVGIIDLYLYRARESDTIRLMPQEGGKLTKGYNTRLLLEYDYRLVVNDTICFELSDFHTVADTMGRTMSEWAVRCQLVSLKSNDSIYSITAYNYLDLPFDAKRMIKKGQYD